MSFRKKQQGQNDEQLPTARAEDVEFSNELADENDREAQRRADEADRRAAAYEGE